MMTRPNSIQTRRTRLFGADPSAARGRRTPGGNPLAVALSDRLSEKLRSYERSALYLDLRGETDAAEVLRRAAARLKLIRSHDGTERETA